MAEPILDHRESAPLPSASTEYWAGTGTLYVDCGKPFGNGETIAQDLVPILISGENSRSRSGKSSQGYD